MTIDTYLGTEPICEVCKQSIQIGEKVTQIFTGTVVSDAHTEELGIVEETYTLYHIACMTNIRLFTRKH